MKNHLGHLLKCNLWSHETRIYTPGVLNKPHYLGRPPSLVYYWNLMARSMDAHEGENVFSVTCCSAKNSLEREDTWACVVLDADKSSHTERRECRWQGLLKVLICRCVKRNSSGSVKHISSLEKLLTETHDWDIYKMCCNHIFGLRTVSPEVRVSPSNN